MKRALYLGSMFLGWSTVSAFATGETMVRHPTSSSIPCQGTLTEVRTEEGNAYNAMGATFIACLRDPDHAQWLVEASVQCEVDSEENEDLRPACDAPQAAPIQKFVTQPQKTPGLNIYQLGRYVFASDCIKADTIIKRMQALTNKVNSSSVDAGWVCHQVNKVDGLSTYDANGNDVGAKNFHYAHIITRGPEEQMDNGDTPIGQSILGVDNADQSYQVEYEHGHLSVK